MGKIYQQQAKQPGNSLVRPAPAQTAARKPVAPQVQNMQSAYGNQTVNRLLESRAVQAKMTVTPPSDSYEQEAEGVADQVMRMSEAAPISEAAPHIHRLPESVSRAAKEDAKDDKKKNQQMQAKPPDKTAEKSQPTSKDGGGKKKEDDKVKRAVAQDDKKDDKKKKPEDDKVKRAEAKDDKKKDEPKKKEEDKVKRAAEQDSEMMEDDEEKVYRTSSSAEAVPDVTPELERSIHAQRSAGQPLPESLRGYFEPRFGQDLSQVRLHTDSPAAAAAKELKAQAFTRGQDIYFARGRYQPQSDFGKHLLAHEITHTLQQSGGTPIPVSQPQLQSSFPTVSRSAETGLLQRDGEGSPAAAPAQGAKAGTSLESGLLNGDTITFDNVDVPGFKLQDHRKALYTAHSPLKQKKGYERGNPDQRNVWKEKLGAQTGKTQDKLKKRYETAIAADKDKSGAAPSPSDTYVFKAPPNRHFVGDLPTIAKEMTLPTWTKKGDFHRYDVDHIVELQLADWGGSGWANEIGNMELLDSHANRSSGSQVKNSIGKKVQKFIDSTQGQYGKTLSDIKSNYHLVFNEAKPESAPSSVDPELFWKPDEITEGLEMTDKTEVVNASGLGGKGKAAVFPSAAGGVSRSFPDTGKLSGDDANWLKPFEITTANFVTDAGSVASPNFGSMTIQIPEGHPHFKSDKGAESVPLTRIPGAQYAGSIDKTAIRSKLLSLRHKAASPITVNEPEVVPGKGITVSGAIKPDLPIFEGKTIDFELSGDDVMIAVEFGMGDLKVPKPFTVKGSTIKIFASAGKGLGAEGQVDFSIERVGEGFLKAGIGTADGLNISGEFNFDTKLFNPAKVTLGYENNEFKGGGTLGIPEGKVTGIKTATVTANYETGTFKANGTAELTIPGIKKGGMSVEYSETAGLKIGGDFALADNLPGLKGGSAKVEVQQGEGDAGYKVKADISAQPAIPGFNTELKGTYDDGVISVSATASYARGMMSGSLTLGATNREVDDEGNPSGAPGAAFHAFGSGTVTLKLTSWLQGTAGIKVKPTGEVELKGKVGLPSAVELFPKKEVKQTLFSVNVTIPIFGPIIAEVGGGLEASASFGPGQLQDLSVEVTYNPEHEEDTVVHGTAAFLVPADAGLRLAVHGGIGASVAVASITGGLEVGGQLGIHGEAKASADVDWTPKKGVDLKATAKVSAEPRLAFDVQGYVNADLGAGPFTYRLYGKKWQLAKFEYGSNLRFGITLPIHYVQGETFDIKFDDIQIEKPEISTDQILKDLMARLV